MYVLQLTMGVCPVNEGNATLFESIALFPDKATEKPQE